MEYDREIEELLESYVEADPELQREFDQLGEPECEKTPATVAKPEEPKCKTLKAPLATKAAARNPPVLPHHDEDRRREEPIAWGGDSVYGTTIPGKEC